MNSIDIIRDHLIEIAIIIKDKIWKLPVPLLNGRNLKISRI